MTRVHIVPDQPRLLEAEWQDLVVRIEIEHASAHQLREMRRAFFAGALAYVTLISREVAGIKPVGCGSPVAKSIEHELEAFAAAVAAGHD